jgi:predicted dehydrogenase
VRVSKTNDCIGSHTLDQAYALFGRPSSVTAFLRNQRGVKSEVEDSFTIILQYDGPQSDLLVTVKTCVVTPLARQLKQLVRGTEGSFVKWQARSTCPQEEHIAAGMKPLDSGFGTELESMWGELTTYKPSDQSVQKFDPESKKYVGKYPTVPGRWMGLYENLAAAIHRREELAVKPEGVRDVLRIIELARESNEKRVTVAWT